MRASDLQPRRAAFTLVEILVSVFVIAGILATAYACLHAGLRSRSTVEARADVLQRGRVALTRLTEDLRVACPLSEEIEFLGMDRAIDGVEADNIDFATHRWNPQATGEGDRCEISYYVDRSGETGELGLWRRVDPTPDVEPLDGGFKEKIVDGVEGFEVEYYDGFEWFESWGTQRMRTQEETERSLYATNLYGLPDAVRVTLTLAANPGSSDRSREADGQSNRADEPPLVLRSVVFLTLADRARQAVYSSAAATGSDGGEETTEGEGDASR